MMTYEKRRARLNSLFRLLTAIFAKAHELSNTAVKLGAYNTLLEPPATIRDANYARQTRLFADSDKLFAVYDKISREIDILHAKPYLSYYTFADIGITSAFIATGSLPNGEKTSKDEAKAMQMLEDYYAAEKTA